MSEQLTPEEDERRRKLRRCILTSGELQHMRRRLKRGDYIDLTAKSLDYMLLLHGAVQRMQEAMASIMDDCNRAKVIRGILEEVKQ